MYHMKALSWQLICAAGATSGSAGNRLPGSAPRTAGRGVGLEASPVDRTRQYEPGAGMGHRRIWLSWEQADVRD